MLSRSLRRHSFLLVLTAALLSASGAAGLTLTGGPVYSLPGGGSCTTSGVPTIGGVGVTYSCTGVNTVANTNTYFGIRNLTNVNGLSLNGGGVVAPEVIVYASNTASSITYTGTTTITSPIASPAYGTDNVPFRLVITQTAGPAATVVATGGNPANTANGQIERVFKLPNGLSGASFTFTVSIRGDHPDISANRFACNEIWDNPIHSTLAGGNCLSGVDLAFYYSSCGDSQIDSPEQCDLGGANGSPTSCCTSSCTFRTAGAVCRSAAGECDVQETCSGSGATCPADAFVGAGTPCTDSSPVAGGNCKDAQCNGSGTCDQNFANEPDGTTCRADAGECDVAETCSSGVCPGDGFEPAATPCGDPSDTDCTNPDSCNGSGSCLANHEPAATACTDDGLICTIDECDGGGTCAHPAGNAGTECRADAGECDVAEQCDGVNGACPADAFEPAATACGDPSDTDCDNADSCDGAGACADNNEPNTTLCRAASVGQLCDEAEFCDGAGACPADAPKPAATVCRSAAGDCDVAETCDGVAFQCPADAFEPPATACGDPSDTDCTNPDSCDGSGLCLVNDEPAATACGDPSNTDCSNPDSCDGSGTCLDNHETSGTTCTDDGEICTADECDGGGTCTHPAGNAGSLCRAASVGQLCDEQEVCDGVNTTCPADGVKTAGTVCRADAGDCDIEEQCDGIGSACPADVVEPAATACGDPSDTDCTDPDTCDGAGTCEGNHEPISTLCRAASVGQACDEAEFCDGAGSCPADGVKPNGSECRATAGACDVAEQCDGVSSACPADGVASNGTECRAAAGSCDVAESCDGVATTCPADGFVVDGSFCDDGLYCTGVDSCQTGVCTPAGTPCGGGETCNEAADACFDGGCPTTPAVTCRTAGKSKIILKDKADNTKDKLVWKWIKGQSTTITELADPETTAQYALCLYTSGSLVGKAEVAPSASLWSPISTKGFKYKDPAGSSDSVTRVIVKSSANNKAKALLKGKGAGLPDLSLPLTLPLVAQLRNNATGVCFDTSFGTPIKNEAGQFKAKNP